MYGTVYENCTQPGSQCASPCGYLPNRFALYTSKDLVSWALQSDDILPSVHIDNNVINYWMPQVLHNPRTGKYVMQYWSLHCGFTLECADVASSDSPYGPFIPSAAPLKLHHGLPSSQMGMFMDEATGDAYVKYNTKTPQHHVIEKLTPDWSATTGESAIVLWKTTFPWGEGGGVFYRQGLWYYMMGSDCCFCSWGGDSRYWTARHPLGPWHPGVAPALPGLSAHCNLAGQWIGMGQLKDQQLILDQAPGADEFTAHLEARSTSNTHSFVSNHSFNPWKGSVDQTTGYVTLPLMPGDHRGVLTSRDGLSAGCDRIRWYGYDSAAWCRADGSSGSCALPTFQDAPNINRCSNGREPDFSHETSKQRGNPCDPQGKTHGINFTVPAQQFNVVRVRTKDHGENTTWLYYGERSKSAPDGLKSHNFQAWEPLRFNPDGALRPLRFPQKFDVPI